MIRADQIPDEVVEAAAKLLAATNGWKHDNAVSICKPVAVELVTAALNAWPEAKRVKGYFTHDTDYYEPAFILPLPQEVSDDA